VVARLRHTPGLEAVFQVHFNVRAEVQENTDPEYIANRDEKCQAEPIDLSVSPDGRSYTVRAGHAGKTHTYKTKTDK
jgi:hypothetical protein